MTIYLWSLVDLNQNAFFSIGEWFMSWDFKRKPHCLVFFKLWYSLGSTIRPNDSNWFWFDQWKSSVWKISFCKFRIILSAAKIWDAAQIWLVPLKIVFNVSRFKPALNWSRFLADLRRDINSLNLNSRDKTLIDWILRLLKVN